MLYSETLITSLAPQRTVFSGKNPNQHPKLPILPPHIFNLALPFRFCLLSAIPWWSRLQK